MQDLSGLTFNPETRKKVCGCEQNLCFITMNSKQRIHFHKFRMQMANSLLQICMNCTHELKFVSLCKTSNLSIQICEGFKHVSL